MDDKQGVKIAALFRMIADKSKESQHPQEFQIGFLEGVIRHMYNRNPEVLDVQVDFWIRALERGESLIGERVP